MHCFYRSNNTHWWNVPPHRTPMKLTPSHIIQYLYCPRYIYFGYVLAIPEHEEKYYKVLKGRALHERKTEVNIRYLRTRLGVVAKFQEQYLANDLLRGQVDEVLELSDDTMAPLDYKFARYADRVYATYKTQLICYAWLIEDTFQKDVNRGYLVYTRSKNRIVEVPIASKDKFVVQRCAHEILAIIRHNRYPKATRSKKRCRECTFRNICTQ